MKPKRPSRSRFCFKVDGIIINYSWCLTPLVICHPSINQIIPRKLTTFSSLWILCGAITQLLAWSLATVTPRYSWMPPVIHFLGECYLYNSSDKLKWSGYIFQVLTTVIGKVGLFKYSKIKQVKVHWVPSKEKADCNWEAIVIGTE